MLFRSSILILNIIVFSSLLINANKALKFENNGYKNLVVSISPDVEEGSDGESIIENIKVVILNQLLEHSYFDYYVRRSPFSRFHDLLINYRNGYVPVAKTFIEQRIVTRTLIQWIF